MMSIATKRRVLSCYDRAARVCFWLVVFFVLTSYVWWIAVLNWLGPSTRYFNPQTPTAVVRPEGRVVYLGDEFWVNVHVVRNKRNGNCRFEITRYAEPIGGALEGRPPLPISHAVLEFVGADEMRQVRWPSPPDRYYLGYAVDKNNKPIDGTTKDAKGNLIPAQPLLPDGVDEQLYRFFVVGRYYCNFLDEWFPRYIQGGENPDETPSVRLIVKRNKP